jgi:hypothetical protein
MLQQEREAWMGAIKLLRVRTTEPAPYFSNISILLRAFSKLLVAFWDLSAAIAAVAILTEILGPHPADTSGKLRTVRRECCSGGYVQLFN